MILEELDDGVVIRRITDDADAWRAGFTGAYQTVFSGPPYFERYFPSEAEGIYRTLTRTPGHITLLATRGVSEVVAFGVAIPLAAKRSVAVELTGLVPIPHTMYLAELGVLEDHRGRGLGRRLVQHRIEQMDHNNMSHVVLRVNTGDHPSARMYAELGFEDMGVYTQVSVLRTDGRVKSDRRLYLARVLSQVHV